MILTPLILSYSLKVSYDHHLLSFTTFTENDDDDSDGDDDHDDDDNKEKSKKTTMTGVMTLTVIR